MNTQFYRSGAVVLGVLGSASAGLSTLKVLPSEIECSDKNPPHPPYYPFWPKGAYHCLEVPSVRRGWEVYKQVCHSCHSLAHTYFRHLHIFGIYPLKRVKQMAAEFDIEDGPNDKGEMYLRPCVFTDHIPNPYPNFEAGMYAHGGAFPPDLSNYTAVEANSSDMVFALLSAGIQIRVQCTRMCRLSGGTRWVCSAKGSVL
eukprot:Filipodium_phascolosomae@DN2108_c0_g1_i4.p1